MIFITGDTHRELDIHTINPREFTEGNNLTRDDYVIICGDFGCIWDGGDGDRFWLNWLETLPWNTLFIDGNHENFDVLKTYPMEDWHGGKVRRIRSNVLYLMRGEYFDINGYSFFTFGGAPCHDVMYRKEHESWWKDELPTQEECDHAIDTLNQHNWKVDYVLTHDIYSLHPFSKRYPLDLSLYNENQRSVSDFLGTIEPKLDYKMWFHGHYHEDVIHYSNNRPALCFFDRIIPIERMDAYIEEKKDSVV